jgi:hypothetical protein
MAPDDGTSGFATQELEERLRTSPVRSPLQEYRLLLDGGMHGFRHRPGAGRLRQRWYLQLRSGDESERCVTRRSKLQRLRNILADDQAVAE